MVALYLFIVARSLFNLFKHCQGCVISDHCAWLWPPVEDPGPGVPAPPGLGDGPGHLRPRLPPEPAVIHGPGLVTGAEADAGHGKCQDPAGNFHNYPAVTSHSHKQHK